MQSYIVNTGHHWLQPGRSPVHETDDRGKRTSDVFHGRHRPVQAEEKEGEAKSNIECQGVAALNENKSIDKLYTLFIPLSCSFAFLCH